MGTYLRVRPKKMCTTKKKGDVHEARPYIGYILHIFQQILSNIPSVVCAVE